MDEKQALSFEREWIRTFDDMGRTREVVRRPALPVRRVPEHEQLAFASDTEEAMERR